jgi:DNA-binding response OmpR family regulator
MARILVVEDEAGLNDLIRDQLQAAGHEVTQAADGTAALASVAASLPDLVILDWMLPDLDGLAVCRRLREDHLMPILMLTARSEEVDRILGLEVGADDYLTKPFSMRELMARVRAQLRRVDLDLKRHGASGSGVVRMGDLVVDSDSREAALAGRSLGLTPTEFQLLDLFVSNPGRAFSRQYLIDRVWRGEFDGFDRTVDTHVTRLRRKLGPLGDSIEAVWGVGYRFRKPSS